MQQRTHEAATLGPLKNAVSYTQGHITHVPFFAGEALQSDVSASKKCLGYDAFGSLLPGRNYSSSTYRFGFQGAEKDDEVHGSAGTSYSFEYRMHDPRVGRFLSIDPLTSKYPYWSPYTFSGNRVIDMIELEGLEPTTPVSTWNVWEDVSSQHATTGTVLRVSDAGSDVVWNVIRFQSEALGVTWGYHDPAKPAGQRWGKFSPEGATGPVPSAQGTTVYQDNAEFQFQMKVLGQRDAERGAAFPNAFAKGMLGLAMGGTGLLAGGGVAGSYLLSQSLDVTNETAQQLVVNGRWGLVDWADVGGQVMPMGASDAFGAAFDYNAEEGYRSVFSGDKNPYGAIYEFSFGLGAKQLSKQIGGMQLTSDWQGRVATGVAQFGTETLGGKVAPEKVKVFSGDTD